MLPDWLSMVFVGSDELSALARLGNVEGDHEGDVEVTFPGGETVVANSRSLSVTADCLSGVTDDGRAFAVLASGTILIDAPKKQSGRGKSGS